MLKKLDDAIPNETKELEQKLRDIMDIEQADELQFVYKYYN